MVPVYACIKFHPKRRNIGGKVLFGHHTVDKTMDEHLQELAALAIDPQTLVFLDTNILAYLYKLHEAARQEFFAWSDETLSAGRLVVPAWVASEYLSRVTSKTLDSYTPKSREPSQARSAMDALYETANLFVDDPLLGRMKYPGNRAAYLAGFRQSIDALDQYLRAFNHQFDAGVIHQQIVDHLSLAILDSDLAALCARTSQEGGIRFEHRLPPGFRDGSKEENRFGDLIIWLEILDKAASSAATFPKVLFVTNDEKSDWVYTPKMRKEVVGGKRKTIGNSDPEIKLADPRLVAEFQHRTDHPHFVICSLATLVEGLSRVEATRFAQLAAAIQINTQEAAPLATATSELQTEDSEGHDQAITPLTSALEPTPAHEIPFEAALGVELVEHLDPVQPNLNYAVEAMQDCQYQADAPSKINAIIRALKSHNWYTQNPAVLSIRTIRQEDFPPSSWFVLGRNIYQAACGNSQKAMDFVGTLETQLKQFPIETAQHILSGILFEIYFDAQGQFREKAKFSYADKPLALVAEQAYNDTRTFILFHLHGYRHQMKFMPGDRNPMTLRIVSTTIDRQDDEGPLGATQELRSVTLDGVELIRPLAHQGDDAWARMVGRSKMRQDVLRGVVSEELAIPRWALTNHFDPAVPVDAQFVVQEGWELHPKLALQIVV